MVKITLIKSVSNESTPANLGQIAKVKYLLKVEEV